MTIGDIGASDTGQYAVVPAQSIDDERLVKFAAAVWRDRPPYERILSCWWRHAAPDCAVVAVRQANGAVAGLCAGRPCAWVIEGKSHPAVSICDWYVDPDHEGKLLGRRMLRRFDVPGRFLNAISISDVAIAYLKRLGWTGPYSSSLMVMPFPQAAMLGVSLLTGRTGLEFHDYHFDGMAPLGELGRDLDRIEACRIHDQMAHMQRGASEWKWRLSIYPNRTYRFCVAYRGGQPVGYVVVRPMMLGRGRRRGKLVMALISDLVAIHDDHEVLRQLGARALAAAGKLRAGAALFVTTVPSHRRVLAAMGFLSPGFPLLGRVLGRRAPVYMWSPRGPGAPLRAERVAMTFADSAVDLDL